VELLKSPETVSQLCYSGWHKSRWSGIFAR